MGSAFEADAWPATPGRQGGDSRLFLALAAIESADEHLDAWLQARRPTSEELGEDPSGAARGGDLYAAVECLRTDYLAAAVNDLLGSLAKKRLGEVHRPEGSSTRPRWEEVDDEAAARMERMARCHRWSWSDDEEGGEGDA